MVGKIPLYIQLYNRLRIDIEEGVYSPGERLPSESDLEAKYNTSRITIRKAISLLANDGYVSVRQGLGTIVASPTMYNTNFVTSLTEQLREAGYTPSARDTHISRRTAPAEIANVMGLSPNTEMVCVQRIQLADEQPVGILSNYILPEVVPDIEKKRPQLHFPLPLPGGRVQYTHRHLARLYLRAHGGFGAGHHAENPRRLAFDLRYPHFLLRWRANPGRYCLYQRLYASFFL